MLDVLVIGGANADVRRGVAFAVVAPGVGVSRFWRAIHPVRPELVEGLARASTGSARTDIGVAAGEAAGAMLTLKYLDGGHGQGCNESDDAFTLWRDTSSMALLLAIHLGVVMALFLTLPYGKFAHGIYRSAALLKYAVERRQPSGIVTGGE